MRWRVLAGLLGLILLAALVYAALGARVETPTVAVPALVPPVVLTPPSAAAPSPDRDAPPLAGPRPASPSGSAAPAPVAPVVPPPPPSSDRGAPGAMPSATGRASDEPGADAGVPFQTSQDGIKAAIREKIPELKECYSSWLEANPSLAGKMKVSFTIDTMPETGLGGVTQLEVADGGIDHLALQGCVMNVFQDLRFEAPENGPLKVNYPLSFATSDAG